MARMYSGKRGKSGSRKPMKKSAPWVKLKPEEIEEIIVRLAKSENGSARIGAVLRDSYGIPSAKLFTGRRVAKTMKEGKAYPDFPEDMLNLMKKAVNLMAHLDKNRKDYTSKRGLELTESKIRRLAKYYKSRKALPAGWKYDAERVKLLVKQ
jgi:small subunit ribosomal protein S15